MRSVRIPYFRIWYSSSFVLLFFLAVILTLISPGDLIYQSIANNRNIPNVFTVAGTYVLTILICLFVWSSRIYTNRAILKEIPKPYIPVEDGEVPKKVHKMVVQQWERSAIVAWDSRPRDMRKEAKESRESSEEMTRNGEEHRLARIGRRNHGRETTIIQPETALAVWGRILHPGWSSPASDDLPDLHYAHVVRELPNLIEAKAVSLAPPDPAFLQEGLGVPNANNTIPDARVVALLQRPQTMGLREYLGQLDSFRLINPPELAPNFLGQYERARFSASPLTEDQFRELMATFASLLSGMTSLDPVALEEALADMESDSDSARSMTTPSIRSTTSSAIHHTLHLQRRSLSSSSSSESMLISQSNLRPPTHQRTSSTGTVLTAPSRLSRSLHTIYRTPSAMSMQSQGSDHGSFTRTRTNVSAGSSPSASLRSARSVIRLTPTPHGPGELPYQIDLPGD
jgi:hypothetical protein